MRSTAEILSQFGTLRPQQPDEFRGDVPLHPSTIVFYAEVGPLDVTLRTMGNDVFPIPLAELWKMQTGYRFEQDGTRNELWPADWLVVATEGLDPIVVSTTDGHTAFHLADSDGWDEPVRLFDDLDTTMRALALSSEFLENTPEDQYLTPDFDISPAGARAHLDYLAKELPGVDLDGFMEAWEWSEYLD